MPNYVVRHDLPDVNKYEIIGYTDSESRAKEIIDQFAKSIKSKETITSQIQTMSSITLYSSGWLSNYITHKLYYEPIIYLPS